MHPTMVVVNAELYCVHSTVEYMRINLEMGVGKEKRLEVDVCSMKLVVI